MTIDEEKQQLRATIRRLSAQLPFRYREAADRAIAAAKQINAFFKDGCTKFQVNK